MGADDSLPMLPWFPANFLSATRGWSVTEKGVYRELLDAQWELGVLPADQQDLRRLIGATEQEWAAGWLRCRVKFKAVEGGLRNVRLEEHRSESQRLKASRRAAAETTNAKRRGADRHGDRDAERSADRDADRDAQRPQSTVSDPPTVTVSGAVSETLSGTPTSTSTLFSDPGSESSPTETSAPGRTTGAKPVYQGKGFHDQIIAAYHEALPDLPRIKVWSKTRAGALSARIRERIADGKPADTVEYWQRLFDQVAASPFLTGRKTDFRADLPWLLKQENFAKVIEGKYDDRGRGNGARDGR